MMVDFMEQNGDLSYPAGGPHGRQRVLKKWQELTAFLNSESSGAEKTEDKWRKVRRNLLIILFVLITKRTNNKKLNKQLLIQIFSVAI